MPRLGSSFATPGRCAFGDAGLVSDADKTHAGCQMAHGMQMEQGFEIHFPRFVFVDTKTVKASRRDRSAGPICAYLQLRLMLVERIVGERVRAGRREYLVHWQDWPGSGAASAAHSLRLPPHSC